ncbi:LytTR family DNA-binding domain-containing protein [Pedobacter frigoris]|uniref:LytR/AlgR family response regulator transcription factor n=1 Tax=Pedobacter frigoris TaxID=2571272 RepID=UPI00292DDCC6|nr:LytTR family DNA-binding domain-containing protein [Pedobacter frigoris]
MRAILVDDEPANLENLRILLEKHCPEVKIVAKAENVAGALDLINLHRPELLFLDIQLGKESGFDLLSRLSEKSFEVIFVTAFDQYGVQAIKFAALDYILKPVNSNELKDAVSKAERRIKNKLQNEQLNFLLQQIKQTEMSLPKIALPLQHEIRYVALTDIVRCEAANTYTFFFLKNGDKVLVSRPLKEYSDMLKPHGFLRVHQSHLIHPSFVKSWLKEDGGMLLMNDESKIPVSKPNRENIKLALRK